MGRPQSLPPIEGYVGRGAPTMTAHPPAVLLLRLAVQSPRLTL